MRLGFLASRNGSNMQAVVDACRAGKIAAAPAVVISNNPASGALQKARRLGIPACHLSAVTHPAPLELQRAIAQTLRRHKVDLVLLAGYMKKLGPAVLAAYRNRILNIHPSLLPAYGGRGMYGLAVHRAVLRAREKETGASVHLVDEQYDSGPVLAQTRLTVAADDDADSLAAKVLEREHALYVRTVAAIAAGEIRLP